MSEIFSIKLVTPSKVFLEANASLVTVPATEGDIGFLANHVNFISSIRPGFISVNLESGDEKVIYISEGFAQFNDNSLLIIAVELIEKEDLNSDFVNQKIIEKTSYLLKQEDVVSISREINPWVSRAALKLEYALKAFQLIPLDGIAMDIGASTGGFTEVLLAYGCSQVFAIDVGTCLLYTSDAADE